jgi:hypothetical protein
MTTPNLAALAKLAPFQTFAENVCSSRYSTPPIEPSQLCTIANEWAELRAASPVIRAENARLRYAVHMDVTDAGYTHDNAMADAIRERDQAAKKAANEAIDHAATADLLIAAQKELAELRASRERTEAALRDVCECADDDAFESLKERLTKFGRNLWREPGQGATDG